jgi:hypothetical protein
MNNPELTVIIFAIAVAQVLTILLTFRRERDVRELRELVDEQRVRIAEVRAWLAGRNAAQQSRIKSEHEPISEPIANEVTKALEPVTTPKDLPETTIEKDAARVMNAVNWLNEVGSAQPQRIKHDGDQPMADIPTLAIVPKDSPERPRLTEDEIREYMGADKAREIVAVLHSPPPAKLG